MSFLFGSKAQRMFKKIQDLASGDMVDQAAVMVEEELETLLSDHDVAARLVPFLMDIGHPDLGGRVGEKIIRTHTDLRMTVTRLLEEKQAQFPRSVELLKVIWRSRLHQRDFNGLLDLIAKTERLTLNRFADSIQSSAQSLDNVTGRELGEGIDRILAWSIITLHTKDPRAAMEILVSAAERCRFPEESLARLSGWIATRTGGTDMLVNLSRIKVLIAIGDTERAIAELPSIYEANPEVINKAIALVEKELIPSDKTPRSRISLARLISQTGRANDACLILDPLIDQHVDSSLLEQAVTTLVLNSSGSARVLLLQARLRLSRGENTQALDSVDRAFQCSDVGDSPIADICRKFIDSGVDREGLITGKLGEFLVNKGSVEDAVEILGLSAKINPGWVLEQLQKLLKRDRTSAAVLTLLAVVMLVDGRGGEAAATLTHLSARHDVKSRQDIVSVLSKFEDLISSHPDLRRLRAAAGYKTGKGSESAVDWLELLLAGEKVNDKGLLEILDKDILLTRGSEVIASGFKPESPSEELLYGASCLFSGNFADASKHLTEALSSVELVDRVTSLVSALPFSTISAMKPSHLFAALTRADRGAVVEKLLPLMASAGAEDWMDKLASELTLDTETATVLFRMRYFIERGMPGTAASSVQGFTLADDDISQLVKGCSFMAAGNRELATGCLSAAASSGRTAYLAREVLSEMLNSGKASFSSAIALAQAKLKTGDISGAVSTLKPFLDQTPVLEFVEQAVVQIPGSSELHGCLALARLKALDPEGYRTEAGTALEGNPGLAEELINAGVEYSLLKKYAEGLVFTAELAARYLDQYDSSFILMSALCIQPDLHGRIAELSAGNEALGMLLLLASCSSQGFVYRILPSGVSVPLEMIVSAHSSWKSKEATDALVHLETLAEETFHNPQAHEIRKSLAMLGVDRSESLLEDALANSDYRIDFFELCQAKEHAVSGMDKLFADELRNSSPEEISAAVEMLIRCKSSEKLFTVALNLLSSDSRENRTAAGKIVDVFMPTAGENDSLSVSQVVDLLLIAGRIPEAFSFARGDAGLLAKMRVEVARRDSESVSAKALLRKGKISLLLASGDIKSSPMTLGEALWHSGQRVAACSVWRQAYSINADPVFLVRLEYALGCMACANEARAVQRLLCEKHPEFSRRTGKPLLENGSTGMISYNIK
jgi:hypothetical protein